MFKILSQTLRPPPPIHDEAKEKKCAFPKVSSGTSRKSGVTKQKSTFRLNKTKRGNSFRADPSLSKSTNNTRNFDKKSGGKGKEDDDGDDNSSSDIKETCHLNNVLRSTHRCIHSLQEAKESLSNIIAQDEQLARGIRKTNPTDDHRQLAHVALSITNLCREAFIPAHRLNQTAIALYCAEDFLRYPSDIRTFDLQSSKGRIKLPDVTFNNATVMKLRQVVDLAAETYNKFNGKGRMGEVLQEILFCILRGYQDFYAATLGCQEIFKVLLYTNSKDKAHLQQFLLVLSAMDRSDLLGDIQELRRILDEIVIFLEKLSWGSFVVYRLAGGNAGSENLSSSYHSEGPYQNKNQQLPGILTYPAYPLLKAKGPKLIKQKKSGASEYSSELNGAKLNMVHGDGGGSSLSVLSSEKGSAGKNVMKKSKFSTKKKISVADVEGSEASVGDSNDFPPYYKYSDPGINVSTSAANFLRIDANGSNRRSMMNLNK